MMGSCHDTRKPVSRNRAALTIALAGNPNCGKSALFNAFTGIRQTTGNWPGVTVERKEGRMELDGMETRVIDLPGIYSLDASSPDEEVTRDYLLSREADKFNNQDVFLKLRERVGKTSHYQDYTSHRFQLKRGITTDFDF